MWVLPTVKELFHVFAHSRRRLARAFYLWRRVNGLRELLLCQFEDLRREMVIEHDGVADEDLKSRSQRLYDSYHSLGGNGHGTALNEDIQSAPIAPRQS